MEQFSNWPPTWRVLLYLPALLVAFTVHELGHALVAYLLGDTSQVERNRLSLNPLRHVSWSGMLVFLLVGFGWAKPMWADPGRFRVKNRAFGLFLVALAGSSANVLVALLVVGGMLLTGGIVTTLTGASPWDTIMFLSQSKPEFDLQGLAVALSSYMLVANLGLGLFNLLPFPLLDGFQALLSLISALRGGLMPAAVRGPGLRPGPFSRPAKEGAAAAGGGTGAADQSPAQIHFAIGLEYHRAEQWDEAIARYRQALVHDEAFALAYYNQGLAYLAKGRNSLAASAFRAAMNAGQDLGLRVQADLRLRELARAEQDPAWVAGPLPPPLEPGSAPGPVPVGPPDLDPAMARRVWLRLGLGGAALFFLAISGWLFVTGIVLAAMM